jgi:hypothetical protein
LLSMNRVLGFTGQTTDADLLTYLRGMNFTLWLQQLREQMDRARGDLQTLGEALDHEPSHSLIDLRGAERRQSIVDI